MKRYSLSIVLTISLLIIISMTPLFALAGTDSNDSLEQLQLNCDDAIAIEKLKEDLTITATGSVKISGVGDYNKSILDIFFEDNGTSIVLKGTKEGTTDLTIYGDNGTSKTISVTVKPTNVRATCGDSLTIEYEVPKTIFMPVNGVKFKNAVSSDSSVVEVVFIKDVVSNGNNSFEVIGHKEGSAVITIEGVNGTKCNVNVTVVWSGVTLKCGTNPVISPDSYGYFQKTDDSVKIKDAVSSNPEVLKIDRTRFDTIYFTIKKEGTAVIEVTGENDSTRSINVTVRYPKIDVDCSDEITLRDPYDAYTFTVSPNEDDFNKFWGLSLADFYNRYLHISIGDKQIADYERDKNTITITGNTPGNTYLDIVGGKRINVTVNNTKNYLDDNTTIEYKDDDESDEYKFEIKPNYGSIKGKTLPNALVSTTIKGKEYSVEADKDGSFILKIPYISRGTSFIVTFTSGEFSCKRKFYVDNMVSSVKLDKYVYRYSTRIKGVVRYVEKGDKLKIRIGNKTYTKKIKKRGRVYHFNIKIKKPQKYGIGIDIWLENKKGKVAGSNALTSRKHQYVFYGRGIKKGMTKKQVKWLTDWGKPDHINYYTYDEQWCYDIGEYVYFRNGRVTGWQY